MLLLSEFCKQFDVVFVSDSEGDWEPSGHDAPDSAGHVKSSADDATTPSFTVREDNFVAFSTPAESIAVHPLLPVTGPTGEAAGDLLKTTSKRRRPRTPKTLLVTTAGIPYSDFYVKVIIRFPFSK